MIEQIEWVPVAERLPPEDWLVVLLYAPVQGGETWPGWRVGHAWRWAEAKAAIRGMRRPKEAV